MREVECGSWMRRSVEKFGPSYRRLELWACYVVDACVGHNKTNRTRWDRVFGSLRPACWITMINSRFKNYA